MNRPTQIAYKTGADVTAKAAMFVITVLAARQLTQGAFGAFSLATTFGWMVAVVTDCGMQVHVARGIARDPSAAASIVARWLRVRVAMTLAAAVAVAGVLTLGRGFFGDHAAAQALIVFAYLATGLVEFFYYVYRGFSRTDLESSLLVLQRLLMLGAAAAALLVAPRLDLLAAAMLAPAVVVLALAFRIATTLIAEDRRAPETIAPGMAREFVRDVLPIGAGIVLSALYFRIDVFFIQWWSGPEPVALYSAVFRLVDALRLFPGAVLAVLLPSLVRASTLGPVTRVSAGVTSFALAVSIVVSLAASWTVPFVYGASYASATPAFRVLLWTFPLLSLNYVLTHQLIAWHAHRAYAAICAVAVGVNVGLNVLLIPSQGIVGAAWATLGTELFLTAACAIGLSRARDRAPDMAPVVAQPAPAGGGP